MGTVLRSRIFLVLVLPLLISMAAGGLVLVSLYWSASESDSLAARRQQVLVNLLVSKLQTGIAHDQESATVWDDAVIKTQADDREWMQSNLGSWMHTYFQHDILLVLNGQNQPIFHFFDEDASQIALDDLRAQYRAPVARLRQRLTAEDQSGVTDQVLTIGESDLAVVGDRPVIVSAKPVVSDTGSIAQKPGSENIHVAFRFLDGSFARAMAEEYQLDDLHFSWKPSLDDSYAQAVLSAQNGQAIGYFLWKPFRPGTSVLASTRPAVAAAIAGVFVTLSALGWVLSRRSARLQASRAELRHLAHHDTLTGLLNRAGLAARLETSSFDEGYGILFLDLDRFKEVNDTHGHPAGDALIRAVADRLRTLLPHAIIGRIGGDEFTVILRAVTEQEAVDVAGRIVQRMSEVFEIEGHHVMIGASVGVALAGARVAFAEASRQSDIALYHAKAAGRGRFAVFGKHMDELLQSRREMERDLRAAIAAKLQIEAFYQPIYAAETGALRGVEALARWRHPEKGVIAPDVFIPLAEELGLIQPLGCIILEQACEAIGSYEGLTIAINASAPELSAKSYPLHVLSTLARFGIEPARLEIEITESLQIDEADTFARTMKILRDAGVHFAIDDFGTGYSTFGRLQNADIDRIKIDKSFIDVLGRDESHVVVEAMISMARAKGLEVTAEGVETIDQSRVLRALGCHALQGYLLSRPLSRQQLDDLLGRTPAFAWS